MACDMLSRLDLAAGNQHYGIAPINASLLGVSGGIAAYKSAELVRRLRDRGAEVRVVMTDAARAFITPLTLQAVSGHAIPEGVLDPASELGMNH